MALYAFDGTWNEAKSGDDPQYANTNVVRFFAAYDRNTKAQAAAKPGVTICNHYIAGVGTRWDAVGKALGGTFGLGELPRIHEMYEHLCRSWADGDTTIDIVGFSRGAATTLDFCHYIQENGIRAPDSDTVVEASPRIRFLGVWDTVAAFGLANLGNDVLNIGHHLSLPNTNLQYCFHALALDETRLSFLPTRLPGACEVWFRGVHSDIGGGNGNRGLNDISLRWMMRKAKSCGLPIVDADIAALQPLVSPPKPATKVLLPVRSIAAVDRAHYSVAPMDGWTSPPPTCPVESETDECASAEVNAPGIELLPTAVRRRIAAMWEAADDVATQSGFTLEQSREWLLTLLESRVCLVSDDADLVRARAGVRLLMTQAVAAAQTQNFHVLQPFFLNQAYFALPCTYPLKD